MSLLPGRVQELFTSGESARGIGTDLYKRHIALSLLSGYLARNGSNRGGRIGGILERLFGNIEYGTRGEGCGCSTNRSSP